MKKPFLIISLIVSLSACDKGDQNIPPKLPDNTVPEMLVTELHEAEVSQDKSQALDLNKDGVTDVVFATWLIGDPIEKEDELLFFAASGTASLLLLGGDNMSPQYSKGDVIAVTPSQGYDWYLVGQAELAMKNTGLNGVPYWEKEWKDAKHKFLAIQVKRAGRSYYGWIELSMNQALSKLILHRAAISKQPDVDVKVGV